MAMVAVVCFCSETALESTQAGGLNGNGKFSPLEALAGTG